MQILINKTSKFLRQRGERARCKWGMQRASRIFIFLYIVTDHFSCLQLLSSDRERERERRISWCDEIFSIFYFSMKCFWGLFHKLCNSSFFVFNEHWVLKIFLIPRGRHNLWMIFEWATKALNHHQGQREKGKIKSIKKFN